MIRASRSLGFLFAGIVLVVVVSAAVVSGAVVSGVVDSATVVSAPVADVAESESELEQAANPIITTTPTAETRTAFRRFITRISNPHSLDA